MNPHRTAALSLPKKSSIPIGKIAIWAIILILTADAIYSAWNGINLQTRQNCLIYQSMPRWMFLINEYLVELFMVVVVGAFIATVLEKYFARFRRLMPKNQIMAFIYASIIPVCSCSAIPIIESMKKKLNLRTLITFVLAAPLLNPYIIVLSYSVLGVRYGTYRILGSFLVSMITGIAVEWVHKRNGSPEIGVYKSCQPSHCGTRAAKDIYGKTWQMVAKIAPYILVAGILGLAFEIIGPVKLIEKMPLNGSFTTLLLITLIGVPIYFCNGADIFFLAPLLQYTDLGLGSAVSFSLTSTAICASSIVMLSKFLGRRLTFSLVASVILITLSFSLLIDWI